MQTRLLPHPLLTLTLTLVWLLLVNKFTLGNLVLGLIIGFMLPIMTANYWPGRPRLRNPLKSVEYAIVVLWGHCGRQRRCRRDYSV